MLNDIHNTNKPAGLDMRLGKTKVMFNEHAKKCTITVNGETIKEFDSYVYLGKTVTKDDDLLPDIRKRIALGWAAFGKVDKIMRSRQAKEEDTLRVHFTGNDIWLLDMDA